MHKTVTYVSNNISIRDKKIAEECLITINPCNDIKELFSMIGKSGFSSDAIAINIEDFYNVDSINSFDIIQTLFTLIELNNLKAKIWVMVGINAEVSSIKDILKINTIGIYPKGLDFTFDEKLIAAQALLSGEAYVPPKIKEKLKPKKKPQTNDNIISLTHRQQQVLSLIVSRGSSNKVIARNLKISESTVKLHITAILKKYCLSNRTQLALFANRTA